MPVSKTYPDRYEIREVRNGIVEGTVLLDRESGRVWMMEEGGTGQSRFETFEEMAVVPQPCAQASPSGNGMCKP
ncbi:MAG: hypothetical protein ACRD2O_00185 [Terriglobia bacterium]